MDGYGEPSFTTSGVAVARLPGSRNSGKTEIQLQALGDEDRGLLKPGGAIIGIDEVGRGALAGPLVVAGIRLLRIPENPDIRDSKKLSQGKRERLYPWISQTADALRFVEIWPELIDRINILEATRFAMRRLVDCLSSPDDVIIVDAVDLGQSYERVFSPIRADGRFFCVAAASIVAKVHRDRIMARLACSFPDWNWGKNKGYPTAEHRRRLGLSGISPLHRKSFRTTAVLP